MKKSVGRQVHYRVSSTEYGVLSEKKGEFRALRALYSVLCRNPAAQPIPDPQSLIPALPCPFSA